MAVILKHYYPVLLLVVVHIFRRCPTVKRVRELTSQYPFYPFIITSTGDHFFCQYVSSSNLMTCAALSVLIVLTAVMFYAEDKKILQTSVLFTVPVGAYCVYLFSESIVVHEVALELESGPEMKRSNRSSTTVKADGGGQQQQQGSGEVPHPASAAAANNTTAAAAATTTNFPGSQTASQQKPDGPEAASNKDYNKASTAYPFGSSGAGAGASSDTARGGGGLNASSTGLERVNVLQYYVFRRNHLVAQGSPYNVFIRLHLKRLAFSYDSYYLALEGYNIQPEKLIADDENLEKVRHLGKKIAERLGISYYDVQTISDHHQMNQASLKRMWEQRQVELMDTLRRRRDFVPRIRKIELDVESHEARPAVVAASAASSSNRDHSSKSTKAMSFMSTATATAGAPGGGGAGATPPPGAGGIGGPGIISSSSKRHHQQLRGSTTSVYHYNPVRFRLVRIISFHHHMHMYHQDLPPATKRATKLLPVPSAPAFSSLSSGAHVRERATIVRINAPPSKTNTEFTKAMEDDIDKYNNKRKKNKSNEPSS
ncbi:unnamed protein product [Notodromas monacha]|uniref:Uncharacterized protein n=1 Tax=Notodromas monacha TaxID=399045 RepID=A0A7R9BMD1_9CRUS|nr:unnamed protein product [Notodromas monacha]CAG0916799.1 unnamed protein product [Notodromas monacha]